MFELDLDVIYNPSYWIITVGTTIAILIGFGGGGLLEGLISVEYQIPLLFRVLILLAIPLISYVIVWKMSN